MSHQTVDPFAQVKSHVALRSGDHEEAFYLVKDGNILQDHAALGACDVTQDVQLRMCAHPKVDEWRRRRRQAPEESTPGTVDMHDFWHGRLLAHSATVFGAVYNGTRAMVRSPARPAEENHHPGQPSNPGLSINPRERVPRQRMAKFSLSNRIFLFFPCCRGHRRNSVRLSSDNRPPGASAKTSFF